MSVPYSLYDLPFAVLWLAWLAYWIVAARNVKATRRRESPVSRIITVVLTILAAALLAFPGQKLHWLNARFLPQTMVAHWLGLLMVVLGLAFAIWARIHLGRLWSGAVSRKHDHRVIAAIKDVDPILAVDGDGGDVWEIPPLRQLRPVFHHAEEMPAVAENGRYVLSS